MWEYHKVSALVCKKIRPTLSNRPGGPSSWEKQRIFQQYPGDTLLLTVAVTIAVVAAIALTLSTFITVVGFTAAVAVVTIVV